RTRNDITPSLAKLPAREWFDPCGGKQWRVPAAIVDKAQHTLDWPLPTSSQYQPAQPGRGGDSRGAVETALRRGPAARERR
ncbi:hypothetical protein AAHH78_38405, partial [Burkholderia pseudomallei]